MALTHLTDLYKSDEKTISVELVAPKNGQPFSATFSLLSKLLNHYNYSIKREYVPKVINIKTAQGRAGKIGLTSLIDSKFNLFPLVSVQYNKKGSKQELENLLIELNYLNLTNLLVSSCELSPLERFFGKNEQTLVYELIKQVTAMNEGMFLNGKNQATEFCMGLKMSNKNNSTNSVLKECLELTEFAITPPIYDYNNYYNVMEQLVEQWGIKSPIIPEIKLIEHIESNSEVPSSLKNLLKGLRKGDAKKAYIDQTVKLCEKLLKTAPGLHFVTNEEPMLVNEIISRLS